MNAFRNIALSLCISIAALCVSVLLFASALNNTVLDKEKVKSWFTSENIYNDNFVKALLNSDDSDSATELEKQASNLEFSKAETAEVFSAVFTPAFLRSQIEEIIDTTYSMASGETKELKLTLELNKRKSALIKELTAVLKPKLAELPVCTSVNSLPDLSRPENVTCRPANVTAGSMARQIVNKLIKDTAVYNKPIELVNTKKHPEQQLAAQRLPLFYSTIKWLVVVMPIAAIVLIGLALAITKPGNRMRIGGRIAWRILIGTIFTFIIAMLLIWVSGTANFGISRDAANGKVDATVYLIPLLQTILHSFGVWLGIISGLVTALCIAVLISLRIIKKQRESAIQPPTSPPDSPLQPPSIDTSGY